MRYDILNYIEENIVPKLDYPHIREVNAVESKDFRYFIPLQGGNEDINITVTEKDISFTLCRFSYDSETGSTMLEDEVNITNGIKSLLGDDFAKFEKYVADMYKKERNDEN